jgi:Flp pilus assembly protein TadD
MKKHNNDTNDGGARDLDVLLGKLKERYDAREQSGIYTSEDEFKRRFLQAAKAQERPHFPMIWKAAAGIAVCLLAFQLVLTTLKDDSSAVRSDNYGAQGVDMVANTYAAPAGYGAATTESVSADEEDGAMLFASAYDVEAGGAEMEDAQLDAGFSGPMLRAALTAVNDDDAGSREDVSRMAVSTLAIEESAAPAGGGMGGFGGGMGGFGGGMGGFGGAAFAGGAAPAAGAQTRMGMSRMMAADSIAMQKNAVAADTAENAVRTSNVLAARMIQPEAAAAPDPDTTGKEESESAPHMKTAAVQTLAAAGQTKGARTMNETEDLYLRPRPRPFVEPRVILPPILILPPPRPADPKLVPVVVSEVSAKVRIRGEIASTEFEAVVTNPNPIALEGEFTLPLPAGATVTGAALDINGKMIDASIVEKKRAQEVFEAIERKGADPALVESVGGNSYRTRIYPIPANGGRRIRITFISEVDRVDGAPIFTLPMRFENKLEKASIRIEVMDPAAAPQVESAPFANLNFTRWENALLGERTLEDIALPEDLRITVADKPAPVQAERFRGENFFLVSATFPAAANVAGFKTPKSVSILWDASGSRASNDHAPELELLKQFFASDAMKGASVDVSVSVLRNTLEPAKTFAVKNGDASALLDFLKKTAYDGGTDFLGLEKFLGAVPGDACAFVFTDGIQTFGKGAETIPAAKGRTAFVSVSTTSETSYLEYLAEASGANALYLNLARMSPSAAVADFLADAPAALESVKLDGADVPDAVSNAKAFRAGGTVRIAGTFPDGKHKLEVKIAGQPAMTFDLDSAAALDGKMIRTLYGMLKLEAAKRNPKTTPSEFLTLGQMYGLVTPGTSMLVLESLDQYLEYSIRPPETLPEYRAKYDEHQAKLAKDKAKEKADAASEKEKRIEQLAGRYKSEILDWYDGKIKPDPVRKGFGGGMRPMPMNAAGAVSRSASAPGGGMGGFGGGAAMDMADGMVMMQAMPAMEMAEMDSADEAVAERSAGGAAKSVAPDRASKSIQLNQWTSGASYLKELEDAKDKAQERYLELRAKNADNLGFFVDCADYFARNGQKEFAIRVVSNLAEMQLENRMLLRVLGYNLKYLGELDAAETVFRKVLELAPEEPQSYRDLALVLAAAGRWQDAADMMMNAIVKKPDGRFRDVELIAITELNNIIVKAKRAGVEVKDVDSRLVHPLEMDLRVTIGWDTDMSDMDLHTIDPTGEECFYQHRLTTNGGRNSFDITQGYGPEEFMVRAALNGDYKVKTHYYGQRAQKMIGPVTLYAEIVTDFGRPEEKTETLMFRLATRDEMVDVATVTTKGSKVVPKEPERRYPPKNPVVDDPPVVIMGGGAAPDVSRMYQVRANETLEDIAESQLGDRSRAQDIARENAGKLRDGQPVTGSIITLPPRR